MSWSAAAEPPPSPPEAEAEVSPERPASPPLFGEATVTGALAVAGASAAAPAEPSAAPTCADPDEPAVSWVPEPAEPPPELEADVSPAWLASPPLFGEATVTGAFTVAGAVAATFASGATEPTCAAPVEPVTSCCALATPGHRARARVAAAAADALRNIESVLPSRISRTTCARRGHPCVTGRLAGFAPTRG